MGSTMAWLAGGQALMGYMGDRANYKAQLQAQRMKMQNAVRTMNHSFQTLEHQRREAYEATIEELNNIQLQNRYLKGSVDAAVSEELGDGRTARLLSRAQGGAGLRAMTQSKDNYNRRSDEIDLNKETAYINMQTYVKGLELPEKPSIAKHALNAFIGYKMGKSQANLLQAFNASKGVRETQFTGENPFSNVKMPMYDSKYNVSNYVATNYSPRMHAYTRWNLMKSFPSMSTSLYQPNFASMGINPTFASRLLIRG